MQLKTANAGDGPGRSADFGRIVGERGDIVSVERDRVGELAAGNLHAVAGVAGKANHRAFNHFALGLRCWRNFCKRRHFLA